MKLLPRSAFNDLWHQFRVYGGALKRRTFIATNRVLRTKPKGIVVTFHVKRSGSTVVGDMLHQHPMVFWEGEIYHETSPAIHIQENGRLARFKTIAANVPIAGQRYYGIEILPTDLLDMPLETYMSQLDEMGASHVILLKRCNILRRIVSIKVASQRDYWHLTTGDRPERQTIHLDPDRIELQDKTGTLLEQITFIEAQYARVEALLESRTKALILNYEEDILQDPRIAYRKCCEFLDIHPAPANIRLKKTNPYPLSEIIENYDEVAAYLRDTSHAWMLK